jgi:hypothetical protein
MTGAANDKPVHRVVRAVTTTKWSSKAKAVAASLKAQHAAGRDGDDSPAEPVWPTPKEQLEAVKRLFRDSPKQITVRAVDAPDTEADDIAAAMGGVDWADVRAATAGRANDVTRAMRAMSDHVDWAKVQPVAAQVSSALIAAVASGRLPVGGRLGPLVAKAITDQNNLGARVAQNLERSQASAPPDFRDVIEATATEL